MSHLYLSASTDAIDAALMTKQRAVEAFLAGNGIASGQVGAIGDSVNDLPFLTLPGLAVCAAPANAQPQVLRTVRAARNGLILDERVIDGFLKFYRAAGDQGLSHVFADRDGVLSWKGEKEAQRHALTRVFREMGGESKPFVYVLTGSSYDQNVSFMERHGLDAGLQTNPHISAHPHLLWIENGAIQVNVLDRTTRRVFGDLQAELLAALKGPFERKVLDILDRQILPTFGLGWTETAVDQDNRVFVPAKHTMFTVNIPRGLRENARGDAFRQAVLGAMKCAAEDLALQYVVLGDPVQVTSNERMEPTRG